MFGAVAVILVAAMGPPVFARHDCPRSAETGFMVVVLFPLAIAAAVLLKRTPEAGLLVWCWAASWRWSEELISRMAW